MLVEKDNVLMHAGQLALDHVLDYFKGLDKWCNIDIPSEMSPRSDKMFQEVLQWSDL